MKPSSRIVWLGYASIALSIVWGIGIIPAWYGLRLARTISADAMTSPITRRDVRGGRYLSYAGLALSTVVLLTVLWSIVSTAIWMP
jgi:hypothetical protein